MGSFQNQMKGIFGQKFFLLLGRSAPEHEDDGTILPVNGADRCIGKFLPAYAPVRKGLMGTDRKHRVLEEYALFCPFFQMPVIGDP